MISDLREHTHTQESLDLGGELADLGRKKLDVLGVLRQLGLQPHVLLGAPPLPPPPCVIRKASPPRRRGATPRPPSGTSMCGSPTWRRLGGGRPGTLAPWLSLVAHGGVSSGLPLCERWTVIARRLQMDDPLRSAQQEEMASLGLPCHGVGTALEFGNTKRKYPNSTQ